MSLKQIFRKILQKFLVFLRKFSIGRAVYEEMLLVGMETNTRVRYQGEEMIFISPNVLTQYRAESFATKEPETLTWIEAIPKGAILWDIGANIGLYSIYAVKKSGARVFAFEPSVFNLELLSRNVYSNGLQDSITIVSLALSDRLGANLFKMSSTAWGGALSTFGADFDQNGDRLEKMFEYQTMGLSMDEAVSLLKLPTPAYIKMDVDGIEHFILRGGTQVLKQVDSVLVEINDDFSEQANQCANYLLAAGLTLKRKCAMPGAGNQYNQWWVRSNSEPVVSSVSPVNSVAN